MKGAATPINLSEQLRKDAHAGFDEAAAMLVTNLQEQLALFKEKAKESPQDYQIEHRRGYTGGGSLDMMSIGVVALMGGAMLWTGGKGRK